MSRMKWGVFVAAFLSLVVLLGCSNDGKLVVNNNCKTEFAGLIDDENVTIGPGGKVEKNVYIGKRALIIGPNEVDVRISGSARTRRYFSTSVVVKNDETTEFDITDDVGSITFQNMYSLQINSISTKMCDSTEFGPNLLSLHQALSPGSSRLIQLEEGCWDILVLYGREDTPDTVTGIPVAVGQVISINWVPGYSYVP